VNEQTYGEDQDTKCIQCSEENFEMDCGNPEGQSPDEILTIQEAPSSFFKKGKPYYVSNLE